MIKVLHMFWCRITHGHKFSYVHEVNNKTIPYIICGKCGSSWESYPKQLFWLTVSFAVALFFIYPFVVGAITQTHTADLEAGSEQSYSLSDAGAGGLLDDSANMSWAFWVKLESDPSDCYALINKDGGSQRAYEIYYDDAGCNGVANRLKVQTFDSDATNIRFHAVDQTLTAGTWYHIASTFAAGTIKIYVDGAEVTTNASDSGSGNDIANGDNIFCIGGHSFDISGAGCTDAIRYWYDGLIDDVRIWQRAITATEVGDLYATPCTFTNGASFSGEWLFDNSPNDTSGNALNLTANNTPTYQTGDLPYAACPAAATPFDDTIFEIF